MLNAEKLIIEAYDSISHGDFNHAVDCFDEVLKYGEIPAVIHDKGFCLNELHEFDDAIRCFDRVITLENNSSSQHYINAWFNKGRSFIGLNKNKEAIKCFKIVLNLDPSYENAKIALNMLSEE